MKHCVYGRGFCAALGVVTSVVFGSVALGQQPPPAASQPKAAVTQAVRKPARSVPDLAHEPTLYVVPYAHLDTQWRWDFATVIREYLPKTMRDNFVLFERYPHYVFNFSGSNRYQLIQEYYPAAFEKVKQYVAAGRWFPSGSSAEENDVNSPSAESIIRQILYGTQFFRREFGRTSAEYMLPDCFGFPASLPSILAHAGLKGFSTQKLSWRSGAAVGGPGSPQNTPAGIPFNVGFWEGPDGRGVIAALNATSYGSDVTEDLTTSETWMARANANGQSSGVYADFRYYGTGDTGGSPREPSVRLMEAILTKSVTVLPPSRVRAQPGQPAPPPPAPGPPVKVGVGPLKVVQGPAEQMFLDITPEQAARLPRYRGDLELIEHSAGSLTSQAYLKRWNRQNEVLGDNAERSSVAAMWLGARPYPLDRLNRAWLLLMRNQMHDIIPGTSIPKAYEYSWNDEVIVMNQFAGVLTSAVEGVASALDTETTGTPVVVFNPLNVEREDVVEASVSFSGGTPAAVRVIGPDGREVPSQITAGSKVLFVARVPSVGFAVFDVQAGQSSLPSRLRVTESSMENERYRLELDANGDVASLFDKTLNRELLSAPVRLAFKTDTPVDWPAWNMDWAQQQHPPRAYVEGPAQVRIVEQGPVRVALEVSRQAEGSTFVETVRLSTGEAGNRVEFANVMDWRTAASNLKASVSLSAANPVATYNWDIGTVERGNANEKQFEVASHQWVDLTDRSGAYGVTLLTDCKIGSGKPDDRTLQLTIVRTPGIGKGNGASYSDQASQDWGRHEFLFGLAAHRGDWREGLAPWQGLRLNQPLVAFEASRHSGHLGRTLSLLRLNTDQVRVLALKKAERSGEIVVRIVELAGRPAGNVQLTFAGPVLAAREMTGAEMPLGPAAVKGGVLVTELGPYQPRTFAVRLGPPQRPVPPPISRPLTLQYDVAVASPDHTIASGSFDSAGRSLPAEMLPTELPYAGIRFVLAPSGDGKRNAVVPRGQTLQLPSGAVTRLYVLAAADGDQRTTWRVGETSVDLTIQHWGGYIGQWDNRIWKAREEAVPPRGGAAAATGQPVRTRTVMEFAGLTPGFIKRAPVAWFASHRHNSDGTNEPYAYSYLFVYTIDVPAGATTLTLPSNERVRILAITASDERASVRPAQPLYDTLER